MFHFKTVVMFSISALLFSCHTPSPQEINIIPKPVHIQPASGNFLLKSGMTIGFSTPELQPAAAYLQEILQKGTDYSFKLTSGTGDITLKHIPSQTAPGAYTLCVSSQKITIQSGSYNGIICGISSLRQLFPATIENGHTSAANRSIPAVTINDSARFAWRGMMLDVARHFYNTEEVKKLLDLMTLYKLNKFHWHLTDDQGWRVEIKQYPELTEKGGWRKFNSHDKSCLNLAKQHDNPDFLLPEEKTKIIDGDTLYGGFYTQEDIKEIVAYAAQRGIDVIPEIDMPGHFLTAIQIFPDLACKGLIGWGQVFSSPVCPGKESTLQFCQNVYQEIFSLFPYEYVHLGADEVEKNNWKKCSDCQKKMKKEGLKTEEELQAWFVKSMEKFFNVHGKRLIGWDEIIEGGLSETATIMWWRNWHPQSVPTATAQGNQAIISPNAHLYFDAQQDKKTFKNLFELEPVVAGLTPEQEKRIIGVQANTWAEWIPSMKRVEYMIAPRIFALSEITWIQPSAKDWDEFLNRVKAHFLRLDALNINYRLPDLEGFYDNNVFTDQTEVQVSSMLPGLDIRYTTDGSIPTLTSTRYTGPVKIDTTTSFIFRCFRTNGSAGDIVKTKFTKENYAEPVTVTPGEKGLKATWHKYRGNNCGDIEKAPVNGEYTVEEIAIPQEIKGDIGLILEGFLEIPADGIYTFALLSDDGSILNINGDTVIDNDGPHSPKEIIGQKALKKGLHPLKVYYFDHNGGTLQMTMFNSLGEKLKPEFRKPGTKN